MSEPLSLTQSLRGTREVRDTYQVFRLTGLIDAFSESAFRKILTKYVNDGPLNIILDLSKIEFIDSSGLGVLVQLAKKAQEGQGQLQIVTNARVTQTVKLVRLEKFLNLQPDMASAIAQIAPPDTGKK
ncbi:STAS domain-containing protein [Candidatus Synechococcus calcipolaris G9]|uniref:Anti-sigma factor antagonist n=1 Tax=Candidatus Synechococcus calcipolaris G9 TaxID=1497997 RepID=A0ABT6EYZ6_9SYNE|nr:STAS domain-containing protein [Candidatus Synechococcus calcipolaris]MDG2990543.1 STAS domain-containing protein [Candidatus Synechococcus calcipolaris G9]